MYTGGGEARRETERRKSPTEIFKKLLEIIPLYKQYFVVVVQSLSHVQLFANPQPEACEASLSFTNSWSLLKSMSTEVLMPSNHLILCCPLLLCLQSFPASAFFLICSIKYPTDLFHLASKLAIDFFFNFSIIMAENFHI